jgi:hypothetical protein
MFVKPFIISGKLIVKTSTKVNDKPQFLNSLNTRVVYLIRSKQHNNEMESAITMLIQYQLSAKCCVAATARIINEIASASLISPYRQECNFLLLIKDFLRLPVRFVQ